MLLRSIGRERRRFAAGSGALPAAGRRGRSAPPPAALRPDRSWIGALAGLVMLVLPGLVLLGLALHRTHAVLPEIEGSEASADRAFAVIATARKLNLALEDAERAQRGFVISGTAAYQKAYRRSAAQVPRRLARLKALTAAEPDQQRRLALLDRQVALRLTALDRLGETRSAAGFDAAKRIIDADAGFDAMGIVAGVIDNLIKAEEIPLARRRKAAVAAERDSARASLLASVAAAGVTFAGGVLLLFITWRNRRARIRLRDSEARFRLMVDAVGDYAIFMLDTMGRVASWNKGAEQITGYCRDEILGRHFSCFYPEDEARPKIPDRQLGRAAADGRVEAEGWRVRKDGTRYRANVVITALYDERGKLRGFATITRDITEPSPQPLEKTR